MESPSQPKEASIVEGGPSAVQVLGAAAQDSSHNAEEIARYLQEEKRLTDRRATLQETLRLLEEDERLKKEQEVARLRLEELQRES